MARAYDPDHFIEPPEISEEDQRKAQGPPHPPPSRGPAQGERAQPAGHAPDARRDRSTESRKVYEVRGRIYRLRSSEIETMAEVGKFRTIAVEDLREFVYGGDKDSLRLALENLIRQGLLQRKSVPHQEKGSRQLLALTKNGHGLLKEAQITQKDQTLYHGFKKPREAHHDADLYRIYQKAAEKIERAGGRNLRVILDHELMKGVYHDLAKLGPDRTSPASKRTVAERHDLAVVRDKIPLPDVRIEYETSDGERARVDIELATSHYRFRNLAEKVRAGFSIYARPSEVSNLRRILDQRELTAEILSL
jgi:hypothetical protein